MHAASQNGHVDTVRFLVELGADPTAQDKDRCTPLHLASKNGHAEIVQFLIELGANLTPHDKDMMANLHSVSGCGDVQYKPNLRYSPAQTRMGGLRGIWRRTKDIWMSRRSLSSHQPHGSSSSATQV